MTIAAWNIQNGGGPRLVQIIDGLREHNPDVVVLSEHGGPNSKRVCDALTEAGWQHQAASNSPRFAGGVLIASRLPFLAAAQSLDRQRFLAVDFPGFTLAGVYFPLEPKQAKNAFWARVLAYASDSQSHPCLLIGDFNTTKHFVDEAGNAVPGSEHLGALEKLGWIECWRQHNPGITEYTWYHRGSGNGFRIDHAYASAELSSSIHKSWYSHKEREQRLSDHSILLLTIQI
jgi:exodeoxyribonuclease-3